MLLISSLTFCIDSRKWSVISVPLKFVEVCFMAYDMVYVVTCFVDAWKEWIFCCYWVVCSINVDIILLEMVLRLTMWPSVTPWRGGLVIAEQWWKSLLLSRIPLIPPQKKVDEVPLYTWVEVRCKASCLVFMGTAEEWTSTAWWGWKSCPSPALDLLCHHPSGGIVVLLIAW